MAFFYLLHQFPSLVEVSHSREDVEGLLEGGGGGFEMGVLER